MERIYKKRGRKSNYVIPETEKMTFRGYYFSINNQFESPRAKFVREIAELCKVTPQAVRKYITGEYRPDALKREVISKKLGIEPEILFPDEV